MRRQVGNLENQINELEDRVATYAAKFPDCEEFSKVGQRLQSKYNDLRKRQNTLQSDYVELNNYILKTSEKPLRNETDCNNDGEVYQANKKQRQI